MDQLDLNNNSKMNIFIFFGFTERELVYKLTTILKSENFSNDEIQIIYDEPLNKNYIRSKLNKKLGEIKALKIKEANIFDDHNFTSKIQKFKEKFTKIAVFSNYDEHKTNYHTPNNNDLKSVFLTNLIHYYNPPLKLNAQIIESKSSECSWADWNERICVDELRHHIFCQNFFCPGFLSFINCLFEKKDKNGNFEIENHSGGSEGKTMFSIYLSSFENDSKKIYVNKLFKDAAIVISVFNR